MKITHPTKVNISEVLALKTSIIMEFRLLKKICGDFNQDTNLPKKEIVTSGKE